MRAQTLDVRVNGLVVVVASAFELRCAGLCFSAAHAQLISSGMHS